MTRPLRLALVTAFPPGKQSLNEYGFHLARCFAEDPEVAEVVVVADRLAAPANEPDLGPKVRVRRVWSFNSPLAAPRILSALRREGVDGVVFNLQTASFGDREIPAALGLLAPALGRAMGVPSGVIAHNIVAGIDLETTQLKGRPLRQAVVRAGGKLVTRAMASANYMTVTLKGYAEILSGLVPRADVALVPHGTFDTETRDLASSAERPMRIVTMGKFGTYKRLETLLAAVDILRRWPEFSQLELVIGGADHPSVPGYIAGLRESRRDDPLTVFHGYVAEEEIPDFFGSARISVFDYEGTTGSSGVLHQTASYGAVPVFPHIGDFVDLCEDEGLVGRHYRPGDAAEMAEAIAELLSDPAAADRIAQANRAAAQDMPMSDIVRFHIGRMRSYGAGGTDSTRPVGDARAA